MIDAGERATMAAAVRQALTDACGGSRGAQSARGPHGDDAVDAALAQLGWRAMLDAAPDDALEIGFRELGAANAAASALDDVLAATLGSEPHDELAVLLPPFAAWQPPGRLAAGDVVEAQGLASARAATAAETLIVCGDEREPSLATIPAAAVTVDVVRGMDPSAGLRALRVQGRASSVTRLDPAVWSAAVARGRRALAHQIEGACRAMLDLARTHALTRQQFGRPIARFQAVRHRLAESLVAVEALASALGAARDEPCAETAALAKAIAGRSAATVVAHCQQVLAGVGFTTEHPFHRFAKRTMVLDGLLGSADRIAADLGRRLLAERRVPTLIEL